jgi:hypothetical protein
LGKRGDVNGRMGKGFGVVCGIEWRMCDVLEEVVNQMEHEVWKKFGEDEENEDG